MTDSSAASTGGRSRASRPAAVLGTAGLVAGGGAFAATEEEALHDFVPDAQDQADLLRRISGLHTQRWQDHFS